MKENTVMSSHVLIVVDMQNDFIDGALGTKEAQAIVQKAKDKVQYYKNNELSIYFTRDTHFDNYMDTNEGKHLPVPHCIHNSKGWQVVDEVDTHGGVGVHYIDKTTFGFTGWDDYLGLDYYNENYEEFHEVPEQIEIIGVCTDICVVSNALILKAMYPETKIIVDASCCAGVTPENHKAALATMKACQIDVIGE